MGIGWIAESLESALQVVYIGWEVCPEASWIIERERSTAHPKVPQRNTVLESNKWIGKIRDQCLKINQVKNS